MRDDDAQLLRREPMPTAMQYIAVAGAFVVAMAYLDGDTEVARNVAYGVGFGFTALAAFETVIPLVEIAGKRVGEWWESRALGVFE